MQYNDNKVTSLCCDPVTEPKSNLVVKLNLAAELVQAAAQPKIPKLSRPTCCKEQAVNCKLLNNVHKRLQSLRIKLTQGNYITFYCNEPELRKNKERVRSLLPLPQNLVH